ncbi:MAG: lipid A biosynthesis acyltransferase [Betaproteobacteria bacterium]|nr:lipid A biosynthesis acyltransferase [Betaproteobacteria bacterium]
MRSIIFMLLWIAHFLPYRALVVIGNIVGVLAFWFIPERRHVTRVNLEKCFPAMNGDEREALAKAHFRAFCRSFVDRALLWWAPRARIERLVRVEGLEHLRAAMGKPGGKPDCTPVILLAPHFAGLDAGFTRLSCDVDMVSMYANQKNARFGELLKRGRTRFGDQRLVSRQEGIRSTLSAMRAGRPFYYLPDQDYGPRDTIFVPFFGVPAATLPGLSRIAQVAVARVLPCVTRMLPGAAGYVLRIDAPWDNFPTGDLAADTRRMNEYIERRVLEMPEQYLWMHKRFKTRPAGEARFYRD